MTSRSPDQLRILSAAMVARWINWSVAGTGMLLLIAALFFSNVTLTSSDYQPVLRSALACCALAAVLFAIPLVRGPMLWRIAGLGLLVFDVLVVLSFTDALHA